MSIRTDVAKKMEEKPRSTQCTANGCPLPGSICGSTHPSEGTDWFCRFHFGTRPDKWGGITHKIKTGVLGRDTEPEATKKLEVINRSGAKGSLAWAHQVQALCDAGMYGDHLGKSLAYSILKTQREAA